MENMEITATTWTELFGKRCDVLKAKSFIENKMKEHYQSFVTNKKTSFVISNNIIMSICAFGEDDESRLLMSYKSPNDDDDGDLYYISDYGTPEEMFIAMLTETKQIIEDEEYASPASWLEIIGDQEDKK